MLAARLAASVLHHLSDFVSKEASPALPALRTLTGVRHAVSEKCMFLGTKKPVADLELLRDVADVFKHHRPDRRSAKVAASNNIIAIETGFGELPYSEGKYGGVDEVIVTSKTVASERCRPSYKTSSMPGKRCWASLGYRSITTKNYNCRSYAKTLNEMQSCAP